MFRFDAESKARRLAHCRRASTAIATVLAFFSLSTAVIAADGTNKPGDWPLYHGNSKSRRYSELDQINKTNVERLKVAWIHQPGDITGGLQATPIVIDGVLYYISANNKVQALDAASGKELWRYETKLDPVASEVFFERETIPRSETASTKLFKEAAIPKTYRPRGSAIAA
jgi:glucose dehydrogenase